tara:strand:- start:896 stop:1153 length:258 start_codon:yes stop_codon:yes gene_type:complete
MSRSNDLASGTSSKIEDSATSTALSGTISTAKTYLGDTFTVGGNLTVNDHLVLGKVINDSAGQTLSGAGYSITGTGTLTMGATLT